jgi:proton-coupled amino acid transporter
MEGDALMDGHSELEPLAALYSEKEELVAPQKAGTSSLAVFFVFFKTYLGGGLLAMGFTFFQSGIFPGAIILCLVAALSAWTGVMLLRAKGEIGSTAADYSYEDVVRRELGTKFATTIKIAVVYTQLGFSTGFLLLISGVIQNLYPHWNFRYTLLLLSVPAAVLCVPRNTNWLTPMGAVGVVIMAAALGIVYHGCIEKLLVTEENLWALAKRVNWYSFPVMAGVSMYSFEGIGIGKTEIEKKIIVLFSI